MYIKSLMAANHYSLCMGRASDLQEARSFGANEDPASSRDRETTNCETILMKLLRVGLPGPPSRTVLSRAGVLILALGLSGCFTAQIFPTSQERDISLRSGDLAASGIAFITPSSATGQEEEKQALAMIFAEVFKQQRPGVRVVGLPESLNAINKAALADVYKQMYHDYRDTGLFKRDILKQVGAVTGARYIAQIKLQGFEQGAKERFGAFGFRIVETTFASIRIFLQIWDSHDGTIAWEGMQEMHYAKDRITDKPVTLHSAAERTARDLIAKLP
ncbi:MAG: hypothetical protein HY527_11630 [Betaproteobacteria bacterium]|nr:hypothetical protein [Betaproteobacteria bacterium]